MSQDQATVLGVVTDASSGETMPGVNVLVKGTSIGSATNVDGEYEFDVPSLQDTLVVSFVGYQMQEVPINGRTTVNVVLQPQAIAGDELIVTGYSTQRQADVTGAVSSISSEDFNRETSASVLNKMKGKVSGVNIASTGSPGGRSTVRIRGISSFQNNDPLYIIDGVPMQDAYQNWLNPNDIESIQVLKSASAASIYGSRASNGVIIIETKSGVAGKPQISLSVNAGIATPVGGYDDFLIQDPLDYHEIVKRSHENAGLSVPTNIYGDPNNPSIPNYIYPNDGDNPTNDLQAFGITEDDYQYCNCDNLIMPASQGTNWWDALFDPAVTQDYNLSVSGGGDNATYNISFNYFNLEGTMKYNWYKRGSVRVNTEFNSGIFTVGENVSVSLANTTGGMPAAGGFIEGGPVGKNVLLQPIVPVYDIGGNFASGKANTLGNHTNPVKLAWDDRNDISRNNRVVGSAFASADLTENLMVKTTFGFDLGENTGQDFTYPTLENSEPNSVTSFSENSNRFTNWTWSNTIQYNTTLVEKHNLNVLAGFEANQSSYREMDGTMAGFITQNPDKHYIQDALGDPNTKNVNSSGYNSSLASFFGKVDYNYDSKYLLSFTIRRDGSSRLGASSRWGTFPAGSIGWRLSEEAFMSGSEAITDLKIRAGFGITGNQQIPTGRTLDQYGGGTGSTFYDINNTGNNIVPGYTRTVIGNNDLKWEENISYNVGLDAELYEGKVTFVLDMYQREVDDLLFNPTVPGTQGQAAAPFRNVGKMRNRGVEVQIGYRETVNTDFSWSVDINGSHYQNEIVRIGGGNDFFYGPIGASVRGGNVVRNEIGHPIGSFYGYEADGLFANQAEVDAHAQQDGAAPGRIRFKDTNGDGQITAEDRTIIGSYHPDFTGGLNLGFQWKNFDFSSFLFASIGNEIFNVQKEFTVFRLFNSNVRKELLDKSAIVENGQVVNMDEAEYPRLDQNDNFSSQYSSFFVEDGSYLRLQSLQIGYTVPREVLPGFRNLRLFLQGENLFTITGYSNIDPSLPNGAETGTAGADISDQAGGVDRGVYPSNRIISIGLQADF
ncbi:TonB-dependent receptor [Aliifodinibius sp. S!AR15-10]|nr:TonB-dependent receptor [Aliifodinibius sp. S!AR15-10]